MNREMIYALIETEREKQNGRWGFPQVHTPAEWGGILAEETGEVCKELNDLTFGEGLERRVYEEAVQTAAVAVSVIEHISCGYYKKADES